MLSHPRQGKQARLGVAQQKSPNSLNPGSGVYETYHRYAPNLARAYESLIVAVHHGQMTLTPEQYSQIAAVYGKCAADYMVPRPQRAAFARKAEMFRMLARLGAKPRSAPTQRASAPANESANTLLSSGMATAARHLFAWQQRR